MLEIRRWRPAPEGKVAGGPHVPFGGRWRWKPAHKVSGGLSLSDRIIKEAERRAAASRTEASPSEAQDKAGDGDALKVFFRWVLEARARNAKWDRTLPKTTNTGGEDADSQPVSESDFRQRQREAVLDGADARVVQQLELAPPSSLLAVEAEGRLLRSVLGEDWRGV